jgi:hypothetical protein
MHYTKFSTTEESKKSNNTNSFKIDGPICPFSALRKYFSVRKTNFAKMSPMDPLFVIDSHQALSRQYFLDKVKFIFQLRNL